MSTCESLQQTPIIKLRRTPGRSIEARLAQLTRTSQIRVLKVSLFMEVVMPVLTATPVVVDSGVSGGCDC